MNNPLSDYQNEKLIEWCLRQVMYGKCRYLRPEFLKMCLDVYREHGGDMKLSDEDRERLDHRLMHEPFEEYLGKEPAKSREVQQPQPRPAQRSPRLPWEEPPSSQRF